MSREIKFRGLTKDSKWVYGNLITTIYKGGFVTAIQEEIDDESIPIYEPLPIRVIFNSRTICQYSGLKDIDGVEIYEGDILYDYLGNKYIVEYKNGSFAIKYPYCDDYWSLYDFINIKNLEVSGNIFENEDLLEDK